jgi:hypothetical protein
MDEPCCDYRDHSEPPCWCPDHPWSPLHPFGYDLHCWEDGGDGSTCMLPDGHPPPHEFTPDSEIVVRFPT